MELYFFLRMQCRKLRDARTKDTSGLLCKGRLLSLHSSCIYDINVDVLKYFLLVCVDALYSENICHKQLLSLGSFVSASLFVLS